MADVDVTTGGVRVRLAGAEADVLRGVVDELRALLRDDNDRADPVVSRLFPDAYDEAEDAESYRDMTSVTLASDKLEALDAIGDTVAGDGPVDAVLSADAAEAWLRAITDLRLAIGTRLDVNEDTMSSEPDPSDPRAPALALLHWLGWLTEQMIGALGDQPPP